MQISFLKYKDWKIPGVLVNSKSILYNHWNQADIYMNECMLSCKMHYKKYSEAFNHDKVSIFQENLSSKFACA